VLESRAGVVEHRGEVGEGLAGLVSQLASAGGVAVLGDHGLTGDELALGFDRANEAPFGPAGLWAFSKSAVGAEGQETIEGLSGEPAVVGDG